MILKIAKMVKIRVKNEINFSLINCLLIFFQQNNVSQIQQACSRCYTE